MTLASQNSNREPTAEEFRVPASDDRGHAVGVNFRVQPGHDKQVRSIVISRQFAYRTAGDLYRHAVKRHLDWLQDLDPIPSVTQQVDAIMDLLREDEFNEDFRRMFDLLSKQVSECVAEGQMDRGRRLVLQCQHHIDQMPDGYWKGKYQEEIQAKYGYLMESQSLLPPADLTELGW